MPEFRAGLAVSILLVALAAIAGLNMVVDGRREPGDEGDLAARILGLYNDPDRRIAMGLSAQEFYQQCHWPVMKQRYLKIYQDLLE